MRKDNKINKRKKKKKNKILNLGQMLLILQLK
jgi:hypothetical protein